MGCAECWWCVCGQHSARGTGTNTAQDIFVSHRNVGRAFQRPATYNSCKNKDIKRSISFISFIRTAPFRQTEALQMTYSASRPAIHAHLKHVCHHLRAISIPHTAQHHLTQAISPAPAFRSTARLSRETAFLPWSTLSASVICLTGLPPYPRGSLPRPCRLPINTSPISVPVPPTLPVDIFVRLIV